MITYAIITSLEIDGKIKGCVALNIVWDDLAEIKALAVDESVRGHGWGKKLLEECMKEAKELGIKESLRSYFDQGFFQ